MYLDYLRFDPDFLIFLAVELFVIGSYVLLVYHSRRNGGFFDRRLRVRRIDDRRIFTVEEINRIYSNKRNGDRRAARRRSSDQITVPAIV